MTLRLRSFLAIALAAAGVVACSNSSGAASSSSPDAAFDGAEGEDAADATADSATIDAPPPDGSLGCPASCPSGDIIVYWNDSSPGFPGSSGCACKPDPCGEGGVGCPCESACEALAHGGCCNWSGAMLMCNECG
jgi:hypothetical protein